MPPKRAGTSSSALPFPILPVSAFFKQGGDNDDMDHHHCAVATTAVKSIIIIPPPPKKKKPNPSVAAVPAMIPPPKSSFFKPGNGKCVIPRSETNRSSTATTAPSSSSYYQHRAQPQFAPRRSFLYNKQTDEPYAEWIGNEAVCLETGEVLFVSKRGENDDDEFGSFSGDFGSSGSDPFVKRFDFTPPTQKHPKDRSISSQDLIDRGILTIENFRSGNAALSIEAYNDYMELLSTAAAVRG